MQSFRRAALRAACSSSRAAAAPRQQVASFAVQISKQNLPPITSLLVSRAFSQTARSADDAADSATKSFVSTDNVKKGFTVFVGNMSYDATETHLHEAFGKYGDILSISIPRDGRGSARGYAFVNFAEQSSVDSAVEGANQSFWHGRRILVQPRAQAENPKPSRFASREPTEPTAFLYIGNIPYETSDADLNALFNELQGVKDVRVAIDRNTGWPRGFAHADFESVEAATVAKELLSKRQMGGRTLRADFSEKRKDNARSQSSRGSESGGERSF